MNAITWTFDAYQMFGNLEIAFEHMYGHTYKIDHVDPDQFFPTIQLPVTRT